MGILQSSVCSLKGGVGQSTLFPYYLLPSGHSWFCYSLCALYYAVLRSESSYLTIPAISYLVFHIIYFLISVLLPFIMHRAIRKLTRLTRRAGQWSKNSIENEMKRKHLSFDDGYGPPGFGGRGASSSESHDDDGMGFLISLLVPDRGDNKTSKSGLTQTGLKNIFTLFPDICPRYLTTLYQDMLARKIRICEEAMVDAILQKEAYPTKNDSKRRKLAEDKGKKTRWGYGDQVKRDTRYWKCW